MKEVRASAPMRVSFAGGGSDFRSFARVNGGSVFSVGLKWRVHVLVHPLSDSALERYRCSYATVESRNAISEIAHPTIRESLALLEWSSPVGIYTWSDVPSRMGLGGSSAFVVALLAALHRYRNETVGPYELAKQAIAVERTRANEPGGEQDQYSAALGSIRHYTFGPGASVSAKKVREDLLHLFDTQLALISLGAETSRTDTAQGDQLTRGLSARASEDQAVQKKIASALAGELSSTDVTPEDALRLIGVAMRKSQDHKVSLYSPSSDAANVLALVKNAGSAGEKICGAGGGGFVAVLIPPDKCATVTETVRGAGYNIYFPGTSPDGVLVSSA